MSSSPLVTQTIDEEIEGGARSARSYEAKQLENWRDVVFFLRITPYEMCNTTAVVHILHYMFYVNDNKNLQSFTAVALSF